MDIKHVELVDMDKAEDEEEHFDGPPVQMNYSSSSEDEFELNWSKEGKKICMAITGFICYMMMKEYPYRIF